MTANDSMTATWNDKRLSLHFDQRPHGDDRYRWYADDIDAEVSAPTVAEACELANAAWPGIEFDFTLTDKF